MSDVVVTDEGAFFCESIGFLEISFDDSKTHKPDGLLKIVYVEPGRAPFVSEVANNLKPMAGGFLPISIAKENRLEYYEALDTYAVSRNLLPFAEMVADLEEQRLDEYLGIVCGMDMEGTDAGPHLEM